MDQEMEQSGAGLPSLQPSQWKGLGMTAVEASRAVAETKAAIQMAKMDRRDLVMVERQIEGMCKRQGLAEAAQYAYRKGGQMVTGPSIRLAEALAQVYGNLDYGIVELEQRQGESVMMAYCHDLENNVRQRRVFTVRHEQDTRQGSRPLSSQRDIYELTANHGARRLRACILSIIPGDLVDKAEKLCEETLKNGGGVPLRDRILGMTKAFEELGVTTAMIEKHLKHKLDATIEIELVRLRKLYQSIKDGMTSVTEVFGEADKQPGAAASDVMASLKGQVPQQPQAPQQPEAPTTTATTTKDTKPPLGNNSKAAKPAAAAATAAAQTGPLVS